MEELLKNLNQTAAPYQKNINLSILIDEIALRYPEKTAVYYNQQSLNYQQLIARANQFSAYLSAQGIKAGDIVGLAAECSIEMLICMIGMLKTGAIYVPIDPTYPQDRIDFMLADSNAKLLLVSKDYENRIQSSASTMVIQNIWPQLINFTIENPVPNAKGTDLAYILYTSGSTGRPKGVEITHRNLVNLLTSIQSKPGITAEDRLLAITTISFDIAGLELFLPLVTGAQLVICDSETARDGRLLLDILEQRNISIMQATPSTWRMMIDSGWTKKYPIKAFCGGEPLSEDLAKMLLSRSAELWNMYGPTETTIYSIIKKISKEDQIITIGQPIQNTQVYILDEVRDVVAPGITGEIFIGGDGVAAGYLNQPVLTDLKFIKDPFNDDPEARLYRTGDLGKLLNNGDIEYQGRIDQQVKIRGHRIELGEIESILTEQTGVKQAIVVAREDIPGHKYLVAYMIPSDVSLSTLHLRNVLKSKLPSYMVPNDFVLLDAFPLTPNYKVDKNALPKPSAKSRQTSISQLPTDETQKSLLTIWSDVLGIENIGIQDDFFEMGGHSILAVKVMSAIEIQTGKRHPLAILFDHSTIEKLAKKINSNEEEKWQALVPIKSSGTKNPLYLIHGAGLNIILFRSITRYLDPQQPVYGLQALGLNKPMELPQTIEEIAAIYLSEIIDANPKGPYALVGYSLGGIIAFEIARQMKRMGKEVSLLGMMDTYAGNGDAEDSAPVKLLKKGLRQFKKIPFIFNSLLKYPGETIEYQFKMISNKFSRNADNYDIPDTEFFSPYENTIYNTYRQAQAAYVLRPIDLEISLFKVEKRLYFLEDMATLGWTRFTKKTVKVYNVPGDHKTFIYLPYDQKFAEILQTVLDKV